MSGITLRGMTWNHPRGLDPMVACSALWRERTGVAITWDARSLQDFESFPVEELARRYDLIVIDHPHVGQITDEGCLLPLDRPERRAELEALAKASVGLSFPSYRWRQRQWALPIDAAAQVQAWRPDLIGQPASDWDAVLDLARAGCVALPLRPPHNLMSFFTLAANLGHACATEGDRLIAPEDGAVVVEMLRQLVALVDPGCFDKDPIAVFEAMAAAGSTIACAPLIYGYVSYARDGFRPHRIAFADIPAAGGAGPAGSAIGGTGIAVSARTAHADEALAFAYWIAGSAVQAGPYATAGGQPGHGDAWSDGTVNAETGGFYEKTRATLEGGWLRPRHSGSMGFQTQAASRLDQGLREGEPAGPIVAELNRLFADSFAR